MAEFDENLIKEFRANGGKVLSGPFVKAPLLLLTTVGAKSGGASKNEETALLAHMLPE